MSDSSAQYYNIRLNDALREIDPEFADQWILPFFRQDGTFAPFPDTDFSPLSGRDSLISDEMEEQFTALFPDADLRSALEDIPAPEELVDIALQHGRGEEGERMFGHLVLSVSARYSRSQADFIALPDLCREAVTEALVSFTPGWNGGYFHWYLRVAAIRYLWKRHPDNPWQGADGFHAEYRLRDLESRFCPESGEAPPSVALSFSYLGRIFRKLEAEDPLLFQDTLDRLTPREAQILQIVLEENSLLTLYDAADLFGVSPHRILMLMRKYRWRMRRPRSRTMLEGYCDLSGTGAGHN